MSHVAGKSSRQLFKGEKGFTLIEVIITAVILLIALGSLLYNFVTCSILNEANNNLFIATNDAQMVLEQIRAEPFSNINNFCTNYPPFAFTNLIAEQVTCTPTGLWPGNLIQVDVQIDWTERGARNRFIILSARYAIGQ